MFEMFKNEHFSEQKGVGHMELNARQIDMAAYLKQNRCATVKKLAAHFYVSEMTVRRDLKELELRGYLKRYHGGAIIDSDSILPINIRKFTHFDDRDAIMKSAQKHLKDSMSVFLDSSSTCMYIIPAIAEFSNITIVTNSVQNVLLAQRYHINCVIAGGNYYGHDMCTIGSLAAEFLSEINVDAAFFSAQGISEDGIISDSNESQTAIRKIMMKNSKKNIILLDKSKLNSKYLYTLCKADDADEIIIMPE